LAFEILNPNGNVDLLARPGARPLPDEVNFDYVSAALGNSDEAIVVITNSVPVPVKRRAGGYLGVFNRTVNPVSYTIRATETGPPTIIHADQRGAVHQQRGPGPACRPTSSGSWWTRPNTAALFELYRLSGNADPDAAGGGSLPFAPPVL